MDFKFKVGGKLKEKNIEKMKKHASSRNFAELIRQYQFKEVI